MPTCEPTKKELRTRIQDQLSELSPEVIRQRSAEACALLTEQPEYRNAEIVLVFLPVKKEISTTPLVLRAWQDRKRVLAPRVSWEQRRMMPIEIRSLKEHIEKTPFNMRQPVQGNPIPVSMIDLVIVPGLGFDSAGNRLGRGRGFYDRFLANAEFQGTTCGLALEEQLVSAIPIDPHDIQIDMLVTDSQVRRFG